MSVLQVQRHVHCQLPAIMSQLVPKEGLSTDALPWGWKLLLMEQVLRHSTDMGNVSPEDSEAQPAAWHHSWVDSTRPDGIEQV